MLIIAYYENINWETFFSYDNDQCSFYWPESRSNGRFECYAVCYLGNGLDFSLQSFNLSWLHLSSPRSDSKLLSAILHKQNCQSLPNLFPKWSSLWSNCLRPFSAVPILVLLSIEQIMLFVIVLPNHGLRKNLSIKVSTLAT